MLVQSPTSPLIGAALASQARGIHVAAVSVPVLHDVIPDLTYPVSQVGVHVLPDANVPVQSPAPPLLGATLALHGLA